jgi:cytoskeletal protein CcmA (bactofilin family)
MSRERPLAALLGRGAQYSGELRFEGRVRVEGHFSGRIFTEDVLEIAEGGTVEGEIDAATLVIAGTANGKIHARDRVVLRPTGLLRGHLDTALLETHAGARIDATLKVGA